MLHRSFVSSTIYKSFPIIPPRALVNNDNIITTKTRIIIIVAIIIILISMRFANKSVL